MRYDHAESKLLEQPFPLAKDLYRKLQAGEELSLIHILFEQRFGGCVFLCRIGLFCGVAVL